MPASALNHASLISRYLTSATRLFLLDWDGTLTPIVRDPAVAVPTPAVLQVLQRLCANAKNDVWVISGRESAFLGEHFASVPSVGLSAEHGAFVRRPGRADWEDMSDSADRAWKNHVMMVFEEFTARTPGSVIELRNVSITWHNRNAEPGKGDLNSKDCRSRLEADLSVSLEVMGGKMCLEVRPGSVNKGVIVQRILSGYTNGREQAVIPDFILCIGDDVTDEDMFHAAHGSNRRAKQTFTVSVGPASKETTASWYLEDPADVIALLEKLEPDATESHDEL
ncbi:MAG: hypothetical protein Q9173_001341 [Seirophora scorigena]